MEDDQQPLGEEEEEVQADTVQHYICIYIYIYYAKAVIMLWSSWLPYYYDMR